MHLRLTRPSAVPKNLQFFWIELDDVFHSYFTSSTLSEQDESFFFQSDLRILTQHFCLKLSVSVSFLIRYIGNSWMNSCDWSSEPNQPFKEFTTPLRSTINIYLSELAILSPTELTRASATVIINKNLGSIYKTKKLYTLTALVSYFVHFFISQAFYHVCPPSVGRVSANFTGIKFISQTSCCSSLYLEIQRTVAKEKLIFKNINVL